MFRTLHLTLFLSFLVSGLSAHQEHKRLLIFAHNDDSDLAEEVTTNSLKKKIYFGPITISTIQAIISKSGIIVIEPNILEKIFGGFFYNELVLQKIIPELSDKSYTLYHHAASSACILIPKKYSEKKKNTGMKLHKLSRHKIPQTDVQFRALQEAQIFNGQLDMPKLLPVFVPNTNTIWNIFLCGHGNTVTQHNRWYDQFFGTAFVAGMSLQKMCQFLLQLNKHLTVNLLYYLTCYGGTLFRSKKLNVPLTYDLISASFSNSVMYSALQVENFKNFFQLLETPGVSNEQAILTLANPEKNANPADYHGVSAIPRIKKRGTHQVVALTQHPALHNSIHELFAQKKPTNIKNKNIVIVQDSIIEQPVTLYKYKTTILDTEYVLLPAVISGYNKDTAVHRFKKLILPHASLYDFGIDSINSQSLNGKDKVTLLFDEVDALNDFNSVLRYQLPKLYTHTSFGETILRDFTGQYRETTEIPTTERITIEQGIIASQKQKVDVSFIITTTNNQKHALRISSFILPKKHLRFAQEPFLTKQVTLVLTRKNIEKHRKQYSRLQKRCS